jgi:polar amino acid transport system substrate-binding protein
LTVREELSMLRDFRTSRQALFVALALALTLGGVACGSDDDGGSTGATAVTGSTGTETGTTGAQAAPTELVRDGEFTVCTDPSYPPLEYFDEQGEYVGFDIAVARVVADGWGLEPSFEETAFAGLLPALDAGRCDVAWSGLFLDPERTAVFSAVPYQETTSVILVQAGNPAGISSPDDLSGKTVVSQNGTNLLKLAQKISDDLAADGKEPSNVQGYDKFNEAIQQLVVGRADAVITQDIDAAFRALEQPGQFEVAYRFPNPETFGVYYQPTNTDLGDKLYAALAELDQSGELAKIAENEGMPADGINVQEPVGD